MYSIIGMVVFEDSSQMGGKKVHAGLVHIRRLAYCRLGQWYSKWGPADHFWSLGEFLGNKINKWYNLKLALEIHQE